MGLVFVGIENRQGVEPMVSRLDERLSASPRALRSKRMVLERRPLTDKCAMRHDANFVQALQAHGTIFREPAVAVLIIIIIIIGMIHAIADGTEGRESVATGA
jgi:hypothetical protein